MTSRWLLGTMASPHAAQASPRPRSVKARSTECDCDERPTLRDPASFQDELDGLLTTDEETQAANVMRRQISRAIRRMVGEPADGEVSEEQLFAGVVAHELRRRTDRDTYIAFTDRVRLLSKSVASGHSTEDAVKVALKELVDRRVISQRAANSIYSRAFAASQLDNNDCALFDSRGGRRDHSSTATDFQSALLAGTLGLVKAQRGQLEILPRSVRERAAGHRWQLPTSNSRPRFTHTA